MATESGDRPSQSTGEEAGAEGDGAYLERVAERLEHSYDLEREHHVHGEAFELYGQLRVEHRKQFFHPSITYADHGSQEHLFVRHTPSVRRADLERLVELGNTLAEEWIDPDETHYSTEFTFVVLASEITESVRAFVDGFRDRTLIKLGYYGHYEVHLVVVAPDDQDIVESKNAGVGTVFAPWRPEPTGLFDRLVRRLKP